MSADVKGDLGSAVLVISVIDLTLFTLLVLAE